MNFGPSELLIVLVVLLVVFGGSKIPKLARNLGQAQSEFKKGLSQAGESSDAPPAPAEAAASAGDAPPVAAAPSVAEAPTTFAPPPPPPPGAGQAPAS
jgi:sec-independent protein translocase protein TatA